MDGVPHKDNVYGAVYIYEYIFKKAVVSYSKNKQTIKLVAKGMICNSMTISFFGILLVSHAKNIQPIF